MKVLVVDDEPLARERLLRFLQDIDFVHWTATAAHGEEALVKIKHEAVDVVLLDIRMPGMTGLEAAAEIRKHPTPPAVVFCTAFDQYALDAFKVNAESYLLKPVQRTDLLQVLEQCQRLTQAQQSALEQQASPVSMVLHSGRGKELIPMKDVYYCRAEQKYVSVFCRQGERISDDSLKALEDRFTGHMLRIHRNTLVNKHEIVRLTRDHDGSCWVHLASLVEPLAVSRRFAKEIRSFFDNHVIDGD